MIMNFYRELLPYTFEGFTGTGGAVKPRSSVDVDELRSSKSMDDEVKRTEPPTFGKVVRNVF